MIDRERLLGATNMDSGTLFRVWAPDASLVSVECLEHGKFMMQKSDNGYFSVMVSECSPGDLYRFSVDSAGSFPDPASRFQPQGVHGPSQVIDPYEFNWTDRNWKGIPRETIILYELHIGTFTPEGTFESAAEKLEYLRDLGVTAVELMPVADFAGNRNWGYDGVALFAPARCYGTPDHLRRFVDTAHGLGLAVFLDVVYNHFGPDGAYHSVFSKYYYSQVHRSPWGDGINFDGRNSGPVRAFFIENALRWIHEYHVDGLRLDATHAIVDESPRHFLAALVSAVRESLTTTKRNVHIIAEDHGNLAHMVKPEIENGWGLDAVWSDDFHHQMRRALAGDHDGYFQDFDGTMQSIAETAKRGWFYCGQYAPYFKRNRGSNPEGLDYFRFVFFIQNHDQIGNRAFGDRLHHTIALPAYRAAVVLLLLLPHVPLLFMGQEWAAGTPFMYFTDHYPELGRSVTEGRRREFARFNAFKDPESRESIPDPQADATFESSRLIWEEREREPHASILRLYRMLLNLRKSEPVLKASGTSGELPIETYNNGVLILRRRMKGQRAVLAVIRLRGSGSVELQTGIQGMSFSEKAWQLLMTTDDRQIACNGRPPKVDFVKQSIHFAQPGAVLFRAVEEDAIC